VEEAISGTLDRHLREQLLKKRQQLAVEQQVRAPPMLGWDASR
jgi:hypothetical protein